MSMTAVKFAAGSLANTPFSATIDAVQMEQGSKWTIGDTLLVEIGPASKALWLLKQEHQPIHKTGPGRKQSVRP